MVPGLIRKKISEVLDGSWNREVSIPESFVITGFWRSGTTWLQKCLSAAVRGKTIFEPFYWEVDAYSRLVASHLHPSRMDKSYIKAFMPYCKNFGDCTELWNYVEEAMQGRVKGGWLRRGRKVTHSFSNRVVLKFVRGQLMQPAFCRSHDPTIIHIRRDPRGVIASLLRGNWGWWMRDISVADQLLRPDDGRTEFFSSWSQQIVEADQSDFLVRAATYWALTERFVEDRGLPDSGGVLIKYEDMCQGRDDYLNRKLMRVLPEGSPIEPFHLRGDSPTTQKGHSRSMTKRIRGWKNDLTGEQKRTIEAITCRFGLDAALLG